MEGDPTATICKSIPFDAAHFLTRHPGKCKHFHGGRWTLEVYITGPIDKGTGMVIDYTKLKEVMKRLVIDKLDHNCINFQVPELQYRSTTELMCIWIWGELSAEVTHLSKLRVYETVDSFTEYVGPQCSEGGSSDLTWLRKWFPQKLPFMEFIKEHWNSLFFKR